MDHRVVNILTNLCMRVEALECTANMHNASRKRQTEKNLQMLQTLKDELKRASSFGDPYV